MGGGFGQSVLCRVGKEGRMSVSSLQLHCFVSTGEAARVYETVPL